MTVNYLVVAVASIVLLLLLNGKWAPFARQLFRRPLFLLVEVFFLLVNPLLFFAFEDEKSSCCDLPPHFASAHSLSIQIFIAWCIISYFLVRARLTMGSPLVELALNCGLLGGLLFNVLLFFHVDTELWLYGNLPILLLFLWQLTRRHQLALEAIPNYTFSAQRLPQFALRVLQASIYQRIPWLMALSIPLLTLLWIGLLLMGQEPDSFVRAFTETYKHGLSQLKCDYATCPDQHFLCTIASEGHSTLVQPLRFGERQGCRIKVNRQLLVANAFEELLAERCPALHLLVRRHYNRFGRACRRGFQQLRFAWVADAVYVTMKPLEWVFVLVLYSLEQQPENRIARQYLSVHHQQQLRSSRR
jgi:hypothetical protein